MSRENISIARAKFRNRTLLQVMEQDIYLEIRYLRKIPAFLGRLWLDLPFRCDTIYQQRLLLLDLIPLCYWHEFLDIVLFYKLIHGHVNIDTILLPSTTNNNRRETRSSDTDLWNILPKELTGINISLTQFKSGLYKYYQLAVKNVFDVEDPRT